MTNSKATDETQAPSKFEELLASEEQFTKFPKPGDLIKCTVINASKNEVILDINGMTTGVVRGRELFNESEEFGKLQPGDEVEATVLELDNERGQLELSFRFAGHQKAWESLNKLKDEGKIIATKILNANKGGLMISVNNIPGFLPVSQLTPEHYPRIQGGDKTKILEKLKSYVAQNFKVKILDLNEKEEKLIVSEKAAWEQEHQGVLAKYNEGDQVEGKITAITDFGVFIEFGENLEGLVHISELAWQRIDNPRDLFKLGDVVKAEIINIEGSKIFLSIKKLTDDPWKDIAKKYKVGDVVEGTVLKVNPFGLFVELDKDIHGLAHISELANKPIHDPNQIAQPGDKLKFKIISIEEKEHRLGLSLKDLDKPAEPAVKEETTEDKKEAVKEEKEEKEEEKTEDKIEE